MWGARWLHALVAVTAALASVAAPAAGRAADREAGRRQAEPCIPCHGPDGNSTIPTVPSLSGQPEFYIHWQLVLFRDNRRRDPQMSPVAANLSDAAMANLAAYYAAVTPNAQPVVPRDPETMVAGRRIAQFYHCASCHSPDVAGQRYSPRITGQSYEYLRKQLRGFKAQTRGDLDGTMTTAAQPLSDDEIEILARYLAGLSPVGRP